jgi:hypothetical protein
LRFLSSSQTFTLDNISVKAIAGNHAFQSNSAQRPTLGRNPFTGTRNLLTFTEQFDNAAWPKTNTTISANAAAAPDGTNTADRFVPDTVSTQHTVEQQTTAQPAAGSIVASAYFKADQLTKAVIRTFDDVTLRQALFNLSTGTVETGSGTVPAGQATIENVGSGWYRCVLLGTTKGSALKANFRLCPAATTAADPGASWAGNNVDGGFIWGAQLETGSTATATAYQRVVSSFDVTEAGVPDVWYLSFDGTDDGMLTGTITPGTNKAQAFSGVRRLLFGTSQCIVEHSASADANNGSTAIFASPGGGTARIAFYSRGTALSAAPTTGASDVPITQVATGIGDIAADTAILRLNGTQIATSATDQGTGNYLAYPLYLGRRGGATLPFNGRIYSMIVRFGANLSAAQIAQTETWVGGKTGVTI